MRIPSISILIFLATTQFEEIQARVDLQSIRTFSSSTKDSLHWILETGDVRTSSVDGLFRERGNDVAGYDGSGVRQSVMGGEGQGGGGGEDEVEETVTAALRSLASVMLKELEQEIEEINPLDPKACKPVITEHHAFLATTTKLIQAVQERQLRWGWTADSPVFDALAWLTSLWASRKANSQSLSLIEQQISTYKQTTCFGAHLNRDVLYHDVEIVEYFNDVIDSFE